MIHRKGTQITKRFVVVGKSVETGKPLSYSGPYRSRMLARILCYFKSNEYETAEVMEIIESLSHK